ncbi:MAG: TlpA family protein disulfide reductase, partial [Candidatus Omnitrophica bacterium]|nr:TlpA family protein disulfide reductase [Candidatus Omnitrophota bacterium]
FMDRGLTGQAAPDFTLNTTENNNVNFTQYRNGQKAIVFFWATWCPHCRTQLKGLNEKKDQLAKENIKLVLISVGEDKKQVENHLNKNKIDMESFLDEQGQLESKYQLVGVPTLYFITEEGKVGAVGHTLPDDYQALLTTK